MEFLKVVLVISTGLGVTWAAEQVVSVAESGAPLTLAADDESGGTSVPLEEPDQKDIDADMSRIEEALSDDSELKDFVPSEPLSADLGVSFPSDI